MGGAVNRTADAINWIFCRSLAALRGWPLAYRSQLKLMYGDHHQQPQKDCRYDELDPFPTGATKVTPLSLSMPQGQQRMMVDPLWCSTASWGWSRQVQRGTIDHINPISATRMMTVPTPTRNNPTSACMSHQSASTLFEVIAQWARFLSMPWEARVSRLLPLADYCVYIDVADGSVCPNLPCTYRLADLALTPCATKII